MEQLQVFLLVMQIIIAVVMIFLVLVQKSDGDSLSGIGGGGSGGMNSAMSSKSSAGFLTKATMFLAGLFMLNCLVLALISSKINKSTSLEIDKVIEEQIDETTLSKDFIKFSDSDSESDSKNTK
ncbi:MAG: preprotein translocase subunit SecG [Rickettsiales bacterium]|jgi:preprotein translocase subunit SecG